MHDVSEYIYSYSSIYLLIKQGFTAFEEDDLTTGHGHNYKRQNCIQNHSRSFFFFFFASDTQEIHAFIQWCSKERNVERGSTSITIASNIQSIHLEC